VREKSERGLAVPLLLLSLFASFSFGTITKVALAGHRATTTLRVFRMASYTARTPTMVPSSPGLSMGAGPGYDVAPSTTTVSGGATRPSRAHQPVMRGRGPSVILSSVLRPPTCGTRACSPTMFTRYTTGVPDATRPDAHGSRLHGCLTCGPSHRKRGYRADSVAIEAPCRCHGHPGYC
jgi:hypothetical protein